MTTRAQGILTTRAQCIFRLRFFGTFFGLALLVVSLSGSACSSVEATPEGDDEPDLETLRGLAAEHELYVGAAVGTGLPRERMPDIPV